MNETDLEFMRRALALAKEAADEGEAPIGAIIVRDGKIAGVGRNRREKDKNALGHAEIEAIDNACKTLGGWRLIGCTMYVTLEPCPMCAGAIINARIERVVFGAYEKKSGYCESRANLLKDVGLNHSVECTGGVLQEQCLQLLSQFFVSRRKVTD